MLKLILTVFAICLLASCATPPHEPSTLELIDLTDDFARIYDRDAALPDAERVARFKA